VFSEQRYLPGVLTLQERKSLLMLLGIGLAACLLNPYTFRIFLQLPGDVASETLNLILLNQPGLRQSYLRPLLSPFSALYFQSPLRELVWWRPLGLSLAEWSFYPLAGLSLLSFALVWRDLRWWRLLSWLVFFGLAAWQARNAAFFAVVAGPLTALNLQDWLAARLAQSPGWTKAGVLVGQLGRIGVLLAGVALCLLMTVRQSTATLQIGGRETALGMIHTRALGWSLGVDPSLQRSAMALAEWRLPGNGFSLDWREQPAYQAFFAPGLKSFLDTRLGLHGKYASDYFAIVQALQETHPGRPDKRPTIHHYQWQDAFRKYDISYIIVSRSATVGRPDPSEPGGVVYYPLVDLLLLDEIETQEPGGRRVRQKVWEMLDYVDGRIFILAWRGSPHFSQMEHLRFDAEREAFLQPRRVPPPNGPPGSEQMSPVAAWLAGEVDRPPTAGDEANWLLETSARTYAQSQRQALLAALQTLTAVPTSAVPHSGVVSRLLLGMEPLSVAPQILAIRAARRAVAERPDSYLSWYRLFQAYADTYGQERELGAPSAVRETQLVCALREAVRLRAQEPLLHMELSLLYLRKGFGDLAVKHYEEAVRAAGRLGFSEEEFVERLQSRPDTAHLRPLLAVLPQEQQALTRRQASFNTRASLTSDPLERARIAAQLGLNEELRQALEVVVEQLQLKPLQAGSDMSLPQLLDLYLQIGYMPEALQLLARPDVPGRLGTGGYHQRAALARAALGDYTASIQHFLQFEEVLRRAAVERALLGAGLHTRGGQSEFPGSLIAGLEQLSEARSLNADRAEVFYQAGLVALEAGWVAPHAERPDAPSLLRTAILEIDPASPQANVARRYYRLVTRRWMED
jgi:tetratricopeptide (TPR) repeat protein